MQINPNQPYFWLIAVALLALLAVQSVLILRNRTLSPGRKLLRAALNGLLWLVLAGYVLQISWPVDGPATHALLVGGEVPAAYARTVHVRFRYAGGAEFPG